MTMAAAVHRDASSRIVGLQNRSDMPPHVPRKRLHQSPAPVNESKGKARAASSAPSSSKRKSTLYDDLDAAATPLSASIAPGFDLDDSESSLTSLSDEDLEDVPPAKRQKAHESGEDDDDIEFEDVAAPSQPAADAPAVSGDLELTLVKDTRVSLTNSLGDKKGPSKRARKIRNATHCLHVMLLLWHNAIRNSWLCDPEVQAIMVSHLPPRLWDEVDRWRRSSGLSQAQAPQKPQARNQGRGRGKDRGRGQKTDQDGESSKGASRDWGTAAKRLEEGAVDMSHGDPLFRLMQSLASWWKQRFRVTVPSLRKCGYMALERLDRLTKAYTAEPGNSARFGERISNLQAFRQCAQTCQGSRDIGAQLFTSLLRGLGLEARMVANLPCLGFGWNKLEDAEPEKEDGQGNVVVKDKQPAKTSTSKQKLKTPASGKSNGTALETSRKTRSSDRKKPVGDAVDELRLEHTDTDDESVVEVQMTPKKTAQQAGKIDKDLEYPHYWTEVLSPVTSKYLPVDSIVKGTIATNRDLVESFEPRGARADKARQVMAYIVGHSQDGTAKDVTVRYLKRQVVPGRSKGVRMPPEKIPVYDRHGKVKRHEQFDWFKSAMSGYKRGGRSQPVTEVDHEEEATDLKPAKAEKKEVKEGEETLQYYKQSKEFVLERHLKREEALKTDAAPVKVFKNKAKGGKVEEEDVYLRTDVVNVKSAETWHKQGRAPMADEQPLKRVPYRAATLNRRREILETEAATGEKVLQGLFSLEQTDWIIPPPIENGVIPKNDYGNIDLFAEHMCPQGAVHVPYRGAVRVCKRLQIDYAEAVVGFEFGHRMAVPVIQGVVVAEEHHEQLMAELEKNEAERLRKEDEKRRKAVLGTWRRFIMGLRIVERMRQDYGEVDDSVAVFGPKQGAVDGNAPAAAEHGEDMAGGFLPEGYEEEDDEGQAHQMSSFFPVGDEDDEAEGGGLIVEDDGQMAADGAPGRGGG
ncbi:rad4 transglutaminase-like domain-containing protein [Hirsutella rhossiliensis]|uniref:Rad4 transglutaminase-like domain-containing protein n=1 Tax=Hirsutella rhossiliensis TaxID=111463 RepID=A0A9P8SH99_9HYPO|nr:rad4 transglutaminase-like domain-containing protein [Hirsutella rhossiliensis]KAH0962883.1 rad4 transglutaminase-like domain-containing protein [Hirsutella rhossiliensis]